MAPRIDRKLAAILAADVVGYSRLVGSDETGTIARLRALRKELIEPLIADHHGRVVKLMGDGALVEFASAVDAVECAVAIQKGVAEREAALPEDRRIAFRIGINVGDIIVEDGDILGDGVNVAARLEGLAEPGGICLARNVWNQVKAKLDLAFEPMGEHRVKNIAEPITVYRVNLDAPGRARRRRPVWAQRRWQAAAAVVLLLALGAGGAWYGLWRPAPAPSDRAKARVVAAAAAKPALPLPDKPSIAVLPFDNLSGEARYGRLPTASPRTSSPTCRAFASCSSSPATRPRSTRASPPTSARSRANSVCNTCSKAACRPTASGCASRRSSSTPRTGNHVWSERYDRPLDDVFAVQDEVTQTIVASLAGHHGVGRAIAGRESVQAQAARKLQAYDYYLFGMEAQSTASRKKTNQGGGTLSRKAIRTRSQFCTRLCRPWPYAYNLEIDHAIW